MKNGYDQFFKNARKAADQGTPVKPPSRQFSTSNVHFELTEEDLERQLKRKMGMKSKPKRKRKGIPWKLAAVSFLGVLATAWGVQNYEQVENFVKRVEISMLGSASAEEAPKKNEAAGAAEAPKPELAKAEIPSDRPVEKVSDEEIGHLAKLNQRKKELDEREEELNRAEQELAAQKQELEKRLKELEDVRRGISSVLEEKVQVDTKKIETLVLMYSDMKPPQAAKMFETMDEDLAIDILGRMKKKNAADIMSLLKPEKGTSLTEKLAGYKRK